MTAKEVSWRIWALIRDQIDRYRYTKCIYPMADEVLKHLKIDYLLSGFRVAGKTSSSVRFDKEVDADAWCRKLITTADKLCRHRFSFFDLHDRFLGDLIEWNRDHSSGKKSSMRLIQAVDYRNFAINGDCKLVWEPNRHHQLVVLARAYRASGNLRYAREVKAQMVSWMDLNPFGRGMNWRSPMELSIRMINWVWALDLIRDTELFTGDFKKRVLHTVYLHLWEVTRKYSKGSSANNHLIGEAAGVFVAANYFRELNHVDAWRAESRKILAREIVSQTFDDGGGREQALGYQYFVLQFFLIAGLVARWTGHDFAPPYWKRIERMLEFVAGMIEGGDEMSLFGDADDGYVLDLGAAHGDFKSLLALGAVLFERADFKVLSGGLAEPVFWLLGTEGCRKYEALADDSGGDRLASRAFLDSGYYLLQSGHRGESDQISLLFDCGPLGFTAIAAHGHADALHFTLRVAGREFFVDPGTYDYFTHPEWRRYFRSTRAHNTIVVDDRDQSEMLGPFMWGKQASARCTCWNPTADGGSVEGEHDGYARLADPVVHRRRIDLDAAAGVISITDTLATTGIHEAAVYFHTAEHCTVTAAGDHSFAISVDGKTVHLELDPAFSTTMVRGSEKPILGWVSRGYHRKAPATTIVGNGRIRKTTTFHCRLRID